MRLDENCTRIQMTLCTVRREMDSYCIPAQRTVHRETINEYRIRVYMTVCAVILFANTAHVSKTLFRRLRMLRKRPKKHFTEGL